MCRFVAIATLLVLFLGPLGDVVVGAMQVGYQARESITHLAVLVAAQAGAKVVPAGEYEVDGEER